MSLTTGEEIDEWKARYEISSPTGKYLMVVIAGLERFKQEKIKEYIDSVPKVKYSDTTLYEIEKEEARA